MLRPKKVGTIAVSQQEVKRTNEIKIAAPLLEKLNIEGKVITGDALLTQTDIARFLVVDKHAHYHFTVKNNQPSLLDDIAFFFQDRKEPEFTSCSPPDHGRIEIRRIWTSAELNTYLTFPHVGQIFCIEREITQKKTGKCSREIAYGITSQTPQQANPETVLAINRGHWCIENSCHYIIDWNYDEDRSRIRTGHGPENVARLRRFAVSLIKTTGARSVAQKMRQLAGKVRLVFDYLKMTKNSCHAK
ncbi:MAG TPA: ISAs1 family transposase [Desulfobacteraceae bacterium]|nr:ISAs1 family transposase [Desulfobacteraceae bacterium]